MVNIGASGVIVNQYNQVLLIQRDDTRTWAPPSGALEPGELPDAAAAREVREETGLIVKPVRLVGVHYVPFEPTPLLGFTFRCIQRGGEIAASEESPQVAFFQSDQLPRAISDFHKSRLVKAFKHDTLTPMWYVQSIGLRTRLFKMGLERFIYPYKAWRRRHSGKPAYVPPRPWQTAAFTVIRDEQGSVLWVRRTDQDAWNLPGGRSDEKEPPWETAVRETREETGLTVSLNALTGIYVYEGQNNMVFVFTATVQSGALTQGAEAAGFRYIQPGEEPPDAVFQHIERVSDAVAATELTQFKHQPGPKLLLKREMDQPK